VGDASKSLTAYRAFAAINIPLLRILFRPRVYGGDHLPSSGGCVIAPNHLSGFDMWAVGYALHPRAVRNMAKNQLFRRRFVGPFVRGLGAFPAHAEGGSPGGFEAGSALAGSGDVVAIFPTGARRRPGREHRPRTGAARVALEARVPLVPMAVRGTDGWRRLERWRIAFGPPVRLDDLYAEDPARGAREGTKRLWEAMASLERSLW
jgi:1-acyl-sn-glycerol-3-phosphate acyltransferase